MTSLPQTPENMLSLRERYRRDIVGFGRDVCNFYEPCDWQKKLAHSVLNHQFTIVTSAQGTGKSSYTSVALLWWLLMSADRTVILTGSSEAGLLRTMRPALLAVLRNSVVADWFEGNTEELRLKGSENKLHYVLWSINAPERTQGVHLPPGYCPDAGIMVWNDEASSLPQSIHESFLLSMDNENCRMVMTGNPLRTEGPFYEATKMAHWHWLQVNAEDVPYTNKIVHKQLEETYGRDSNVYRVRVLGLFPEGDSDRWFQGDNTRFVPIDDVPENVERVAAIDVGGEGDPSALVIRVAGIIEKIQLFKEPDPIKLKNLVSPILVSYNVKRVAVDAVGLGHGFAKVLRYDSRFIVYDVKGQQKAGQDKVYVNARTEMYGNLHEFVKNLKMHSMIPDERRRELRDELKAQQIYFTSKGLIALVKKDVIKSELGGRSPNIADALSNTFCNALLACTGELAKVQKVVLPGLGDLNNVRLTDNLLKDRMNMYVGSPRGSSGGYSGW